MHIWGREKNIFSAYWNEGDYDRRVSYIASPLEITLQKCACMCACTHTKESGQIKLLNNISEKSQAVLFKFIINGENVPVKQ
jgi:hypothetical protein